MEKTEHLPDVDYRRFAAKKFLQAIHAQNRQFDESYRISQELLSTITSNEGAYPNVERPGFLLGSHLIFKEEVLRDLLITQMALEKNEESIQTWEILRPIQYAIKVPIDEIKRMGAHIELIKSQMGLSRMSLTDHVQVARSNYEHTQKDHGKCSVEAIDAVLSLASVLRSNKELLVRGAVKMTREGIYISTRVLVKNHQDTQLYWLQLR